MAYTFTRTGAQIEEIHNTVEDPKSNTQFSDDIRTIAGEYRGLWPDTGGSANKGDTYQTQVGGTPTGQYFTALQNTTVDPVGDGVNWRTVIGSDLGSVNNGTKLQHRRGTNAEILAGTPAIGELWFNTTDNSIHMGDGVTQGGVPTAKKRNTVLSFDTLNDAVANTALNVGYSVDLKERSTGDGGGGKWDVVLASTVTPNTFDIVQCTGVPTLALVMREQQEAMVVNIPTDYPDVQTAIDVLRRTPEGKSRNITIFIETGHQLTKGWECTRGDYANFQIASADAVVTLAPSFVGVDVEQNPTNGEVPRPPLCYGFHARMPRWSLTVDMGNLHGSGLLLINCSTYCAAGKGVINAGFRGWQQRAGYGFASNTNFSGATGCAARVQKAGICNLGDANLSNACKTEDLAIGALYVSRSCMVEARGATVANSGAAGVVCRRSTVTCVDVNASNCTLAAFDCQQGMIDAVNSIVNNPQFEAYYSKFGGTIVASGGTVTNPNVPSRIFVCTDGATMVTNGGTTVDGTPINNTHLQSDVPQFNTPFGDGIHFNPDHQGVVESGSNANGTWQKFSDGRMVAETGIRSINTTVAPGEFSAQLQKPPLPQTFVSVYDVKEKVVGKSDPNGAGVDVFVNSCSNMSAVSNEWRIQNLGQQIDGISTNVTVNSVQIQMQVTGTWK